MTHPNPRQSGFTLVELLIVITIIGLIAAFGISRLMGAKDDAYLAASQDNLRSIWFQLQRYESKSKNKRLPEAPGSEMVMAIWGDPYLEKSFNNAKVMFCPSLGMESVADETIDEDVTGATIHWAGRNQADNKYKVLRTNQRGATKTIIACNKPLVGGAMPHGGKYLAVLYLSGETGSISRDDFGPDWGEDEPLIIGPSSPLESLQGLTGHPEDGLDY